MSEFVGTVGSSNELAEKILRVVFDNFKSDAILVTEMVEAVASLDLVSNYLKDELKKDGYDLIAPRVAVKKQ